VQKNQRSDPLLKTLKIKRFYKKRRLRRGGTNEEGRGGGGDCLEGSNLLHFLCSQTEI